MTEVDAAVERVRTIAEGCAEVFAEACRKGCAPNKPTADDPWREGRLVNFRAQPDESRAFLRALDEKLIDLGTIGRFWAPRARRSAILHLVGRSGRATTLWLEYLIHIGAYAELVLDHDWAPEILDFECGEFDIEGGHDRIDLAVEAKARTVSQTTSDTLTALRDAFLAKEADPTYRLNKKHRPKWDRLVDLTQRGPVQLWLVADGARWSYVVSRCANGLAFQPSPNVQINRSGMKE